MRALRFVRVVPIWLMCSASMGESFELLVGLCGPIRVDFLMRHGRSRRVRLSLGTTSLPTRVFTGMKLAYSRNNLTNRLIF